LCDSDYSDTYGSWPRAWICVWVGMIDNYRELLYWMLAEMETLVSNLMIIDSRVYYRMLSIASLNKLACLINCYHFTIYCCIDFMVARSHIDLVMAIFFTNCCSDLKCIVVWNVEIKLTWNITSSWFCILLRLIFLG